MAPKDNRFDLAAEVETLQSALAQTLQTLNSVLLAIEDNDAEHADLIYDCLAAIAIGQAALDLT